jgi:hypothetical protein
MADGYHPQNRPAAQKPASRGNFVAFTHLECVFIDLAPKMLESV